MMKKKMNLMWRQSRMFLIRVMLRFCYYITGRRPQLIFISHPEAVLLPGSRLTFCWQVRGCHTIRVNNSTNLPGNVSMVQLDRSCIHETVSIEFIGRGETVYREFKINPVEHPLKQELNLSYLQRFEPVLTISQGLYVVSWKPAARTDQFDPAPFISLHVSDKNFSGSMHNLTFRQLNLELYDPQKFNQQSLTYET